MVELATELAKAVHAHQLICHHDNHRTVDHLARVWPKWTVDATVLKQFGHQPVCIHGPYSGEPDSSLKVFVHPVPSLNMHCPSRIGCRIATL